MPLRVNTAVLFKTLKQLQLFRGALLAVALELVSLQVLLIHAGQLWGGIAASFMGVVLAFVYVLTAPELLLFTWEDETPA